jgi:4-hydroxybenzoate polyprenyltransferase/phosphoserine phosphatase
MKQPLCVDLDGTLVRTDTLYEVLVGVIKNGKGLLPTIYALAAGKAAFKAIAALHSSFDPKQLPYNAKLLEFLEKEKQEGTTLVLATAANRKIADAVKVHLGLFDEVFASDATHNLRGVEKARVLAERFGSRAFRYAGNDETDIPIWRAASGAVLVNAAADVRKAAAAVTNVEADIHDQPRRVLAAVQGMRPYQWAKNILVFAPILTAHAERDLRSWLYAFITFVAFCSVASASYLVNDLLDLSADRNHTHKRNRPLASGALSIGDALVLILLLYGVGAVLAFLSSVPLLLLLYVVLTLAYSSKLKRLPLVDFFTLSLLYVLRLFAGGKASGHPVSLWLLAFSSFFFLSLALVKRVAELKTHEAGGYLKQRGYAFEDTNALEIMGIASSFASTVVLALYVQGDLAAQTAQYARPELLWPIVPLMLFWQCRIWLSTTRKYMDDDPIVYAAKDWVSWLVGACILTSMAIARFPR